ncbi:glycosyltransferase-like protein [Herbaspirillum rubrisubalbicans M1]|uniref:glycosyltransferase family 4 protein n=1 Tax=Herbaspirillum rubrisubalbicans TaxID=80842 RepID=UPI00073ABE29|nr:glycosyltransferase family 4 protein [Herbaspirillum rubrisubalbicans]ALU91454.1 glycosyltransferase-like protein [Herbaspirillum rubrisubalbicans M1]
MRPDLFARLHSPYYIFAPAYATHTEEALLLHRLCHALNLWGEEAYVTDEGSTALRTPRLTQELINAHLAAGRNPIVIYAGSVDGNPLSALNVVRYQLQPGQAARAGEFPLAWRADLADAGVPLLELPLVPDATFAARRDQLTRQLDDFILASQRRFNAPAAAMTTAAAPLAAPAAAAAKRKKRLVVYSVESTWSPCPQIRLIRPFAHLKDEWELVWGIQNGKLQSGYLADADLILLHRYTPGLMSLDVLRTIFSSSIPIIYESDDLLNDIPADHPEAQQGAAWKSGIEFSVKHAKAVVVSTEFLAAKYRELNAQVHVLPNYIDFDLFYRPVPQHQNPDGRINIGLLGSSIQPSNFALVDQALRALVERYGARLHIDFVGWECPQGWAGHPLTTFHTFVHQYVDYAAQLRQWNWDIALIPLASDQYNQCKSYIKWLDYSAAGIASIFSDVSVYNQVVTHDVTGLLMPNSSQAWLDAITQLIESPEKRHALAAAGQQEVREGFDLAAKAVHYNEVYSRCLKA